MSSFCICKSYSHFFSKNTCELDIVHTSRVNILTHNKLVKLTMLWTAGLWWQMKCNMRLCTFRHVYPVKTRISLHILRCVSSEDSDQLAHPCSLISHWRLSACRNLDPCLSTKYCKCSNISDVLRYWHMQTVDPDQTAPAGAVWSGATLFAIPLRISRNKCIKSKI